jgi:hypothetical protein
MHQRTGLLLFLIALPLVMLSAATNASAQVCTSLFLASQAEVDAVSCSSVRFGLVIEGSDITDLSPLSSVTSVGLQLTIGPNALLTNLDGLAGITSVAVFLRVFDNPVLTNLNGLAAVTSVGANLVIARNDALTNLDGLAGITSVGGDLEVFRNTVLTEFCGLFPLLDASGLVGTYNVSGNATNPTEGEILAGGACLASVPALGPLGIALLLGLLGATAYWRLRESASAA